MKVAQYNDFSADSNAESISLKNTSKPRASGPQHVVVKIHAASLNPADIKVKILLHYIFLVGQVDHNSTLLRSLLGY